MRLWRLFFLAAALNNLIIGGLMLFGADLAAARIGVSGPAAGYIVGFGGVLVAIFGVAYALVAYRPLPQSQPRRHRRARQSAAVVLASWHALAEPHPAEHLSLGDGRSRLRADLLRLPGANAKRARARRPNSLSPASRLKVNPRRSALVQLTPASLMSQAERPAGPMGAVLA